MKKWLLILIIAFIALVTLVYMILPNKIMLGQTRVFAANPKAFARIIQQDESWENWWPKKGVSDEAHSSHPLEFNGYTYTIVEKRLTSVLIDVIHGEDTFKTEFIFIPKPDSVLISWQSILTKPLSRIKRLQLNSTINGINKDMAALLNQLQNYVSKEENLYGMTITKEHVKDSTLISTSMTTTGMPTTKNIYVLIEKLKAFASKNNATITGFPMLSIFTTDSINFRSQIALPVDKKMTDAGDIKYRWMLGGGNILKAEVKGGYGTINNGFKAMEHYIDEHKRVAPAIQFQSLITDRRTEPDSSKWVTKLYWPVM